MDDKDTEAYIKFMTEKYERDSAAMDEQIKSIRALRVIPPTKRLVDVAVYIGRFQPFHRGHLSTLKMALQIGDMVVMGLGSAQESRTKKNPFTVQERIDMVLSTLSAEEADRVRFIRLTDNATSDEEWAKNVRNETRLIVCGHRTQTTCLVGVHKDQSSTYLDWFPDWKFVEGPSTELLNATDIRVLLSSGLSRKYWSVGLPESVADYIEKNNLTKEFTP